MAAGGTTFTLWRERAKYGTQYRAGGWADQPAALLVQFRFLDLLESTWRYYRSKDAVLEKLSRLQLDLIAWLENDEPEG